MNKLSVKSIIYRTTLISSVMLSVGICSGTGSFPSVLCGLLMMIAVVITEQTSLLPLLISFLVSLYMMSTFGFTAAAVSVILSGLIHLAATPLRNRIRFPSADEFGAYLMLPTAFSVTALITTLYFGIGAKGNTVVNIIRDYVSLGFHPNWRGILYGTIVMVIMITFPRKFKKASKVFSPLFAAVAVTLVLNIFLETDSVLPVFPMLDKPVYSLPILSGADLSCFTSAYCIVMTVVSAVSLAAVNMVFTGNQNKPDDLRSGLFSLVTGTICGFNIPYRITTSKNDMLSGAVSAVISFLIYFATSGYSKLPLASCAVILIVAGWQAVNWGKVAGKFRKPATLVLMFTAFAVTCFTSYPIGCIVCLAAAIFTEKTDLTGIKNVDKQQPLM